VEDSRLRTPVVGLLSILLGSVGEIRTMFKTAPGPVSARVVYPDYPPRQQPTGKHAAQWIY